MARREAMSEERRPKMSPRDPPAEYQPESGQPGGSRADEPPPDEEQERRRVLADEKDDD
jgi:hypothetical protein